VYEYLQMSRVTTVHINTTQPYYYTSYTNAEIKRFQSVSMIFKLTIPLIHFDAYFSRLAFTLGRKTLQNLLCSMLQSHDMDSFSVRDKYLSREL